MIDLDAELMAAIRFAEQARDLWRAALNRRVQWGLARVAWYGVDRKRYEMQEDGPSLAFIVPVVEDGELIDLAAIDGLSEHVGLRLGLGHGLGIDAIEKARFGCGVLRLCERPLQWLREPRDSVYLFDLHEAPIALDRIPGVVNFTSIGFADRVRSLMAPSQLDDDEP